MNAEARNQVQRQKRKTPNADLTLSPESEKRVRHILETLGTEAPPGEPDAESRRLQEKALRENPYAPPSNRQNAGSLEEMKARVDPSQISQPEPTRVQPQTMLTPEQLAQRQLEMNAEAQNKVQRQKRKTPNADLTLSSESEKRVRHILETLGKEAPPGEPDAESRRLQEKALQEMRYAPPSKQHNAAAQPQTMLTPEQLAQRQEKIESDKRVAHILETLGREAPPGEPDAESRQLQEKALQEMRYALSNYRKAHQDVVEVQRSAIVNQPMPHPVVNANPSPPL